MQILIVLIYVATLAFCKIEAAPVGKSIDFQLVAKIQKLFENLKNGESKLNEYHSKKSFYLLETMQEKKENQRANLEDARYKIKIQKIEKFYNDICSNLKNKYRIKNEKFKLKLANLEYLKLKADLHLEENEIKYFQLEEKYENALNDLKPIKDLNTALENKISKLEKEYQYALEDFKTSEAKYIALNATLIIKEKKIEHLQNKIDKLTKKCESHSAQVKNEIKIMDYNNESFD